MSGVKKQLPLSQRKLKKQINFTRHKSQSIQDSPWNMIGRALTQRYCQKYAEICKYANAIASSRSKIQTEDDSQIALSPKFGLKKKILTFDSKDKQKDVMAKENTVLMPHSSQKKNQSCTLYSIQYLKLNNNDLQHKKEEIGQVRCKQTHLGTYFIPSASSMWTNPKFKSIYVKKNIRKINLNPQLRISSKKRSQKKQMQKISFRDRSQSYINRNVGNGLNFKIKSKQKEQSEQEEKNFRPWSGSKQQDYL